MQTFLPYADFKKSVSVLDYRRLGKQRVETLQIMRALTDNGGLRGGWTKHPAARMWHGYLATLMRYQEVTCEEWTSVRGFQDSCLDKTRAAYESAGSPPDKALPWFIGCAPFHRSHQSSLLEKAPELYRPIFGAAVPAEIAYFWTEADIPVS